MELSIEENRVCFEVKGLDKLWAFRGRLEIPLAHVLAARADPTIARGWWKGVRAPGTSIPGIIRAGTFHQDGKRIFWDVHHPEKTIVIDLQHDEFDQLVIEVEDPNAAVARLEQARARSK